MNQEELVRKKNQLLIELKEKSLEVTSAKILDREDLPLLEMDLIEINAELNVVREQLFNLMFNSVKQ